MTTYVGHFNAFDTIMYDFGRHIDIVHLEDALFVAFLQYVPEQQYFVGVETLANFLHPPDVPEEIGPECPVAVDHLFDGVEPRVDDFQYLFVGRNFLFRHLLHDVQQNVQF